MSLARLTIDLVANLGTFEGDSGKAAQIIARDSEKMTRAQASFLKSIERSSERLGALGTDFLRVKAAEVGVSDQAAKFIERMDAIGGASARVAAQSGAAFSAIAGGVEGAITKQATAVEQLIAGIKAVSAEASRLKSVAIGEEASGTITTDTLKVRLANITAGRADAIAQLKDAAAQQQAADALAATEKATADARSAAARRIVDAQNGLTASYRTQLAALRELRDAGALTPAQFKIAGTELVNAQPALRAIKEVQEADEAAAKRRQAATQALLAKLNEVPEAYLKAKAALEDSLRAGEITPAQFQTARIKLDDTQNPAVLQAKQAAEAANKLATQQQAAIKATAEVEQAEAAKRAAAAQRLADTEDGLTASYRQQLRELEALREAGNITGPQFIQAKSKLVEQQPAFISRQKEIDDAKAVAAADEESARRRIVAFEKLQAVVQVLTVGQAALTDAQRRASQNDAEIAAGNSFIENLRQRIFVIGKTREELLRLEAASLGVSQQAEPLIQGLGQKEFSADLQKQIATVRQLGLEYGKTATEILQLKAAQLGIGEQSAEAIARLQQEQAAYDQLVNAAKRAEAAKVADAGFVAKIQEQIAAQQRLAAEFGKTEIEILRLEATERGLGDSLAPALAQLQALKEANASLGVAAQQRSDADQFIAGLIRERAEIGKTRDELRTLEAARLGIDKSVSAPAIAAVSNTEFVAGIDAQIAAQKRLGEEFGKTEAEILRLKAAQRGLTEQTADSIGELQRLTAANKANADAAAKLAATKASNDSYVSAIEREIGALGKQRSEIIATEAAQRGLTKELAPTIARLKEFEEANSKYGRSALAARNQIGLNTNQLLTLKYTASDVAASLGSGISPFTILLQQGGQLAQIEGGVGGIIRGLVQSITPFTAAVTASAAAVGILGFAYFEGKKQSKEFADSLVLTGNYAGVTAGQLEDAAKRISASGQISISTARDIAQALLSTGEIGPKVFAISEEAGARYANATGKTVKDVASLFASLNRDVYTGAVGLNQSLNFLTASQLQQVRTLQDSGKETEAYSLVVTALNDRLKTLEPNFGLLDRALRSVTTEWRRFWDSAYDIGRDETLESKIAKARAALANINGVGQERISQTQLDPERRARFAIDNAPDSQAKQNAQEALRLLLRSQSAEQATAQSKAETAELDKKAIAASDYYRSAEKGAKAAAGQVRELADEQRQYDALVARKKTDPTLELPSDATRAAIQKKIRDSYADKPAASEGNQVLKANLAQALKILEDELQAERDAYAFHDKYVKGVYDAGGLSLKQFYEDRRATQQAGLASELSVLDKQIAAEQAFIKASKDPSDKIGAQTKVNDLQAQQAKLRLKSAEDVALANQEEANSFRALNDRVVEYQAQLKQLEGDEAGAANLRAQITIANAKVFANQSGGAVSQDDVERQKRAIDAANEFAEVQRRVGAVSAEASTAEEAFLLRAVQKGDSLASVEQGVYTIRATSLVQLGELRDKAEELAAVSTDPKIIQAAKDLGLAYEKAAENVDPALNRLRDASKELGTTLSSAFGDAIVNGTTFKGLLKGIEKEFVSIVTKNYVTAPLENFLQGQLRDLTDGSNAFADFFRSNGTAASRNAKGGSGINAAGAGFSAAKDTGVTLAETDAAAAQVQAVTTSTTAITELSAAAQSAAASLNRISGPVPLVPGADNSPLVIDTSGIGINAAGAGFSAAKDGAIDTTSAAAASKLLDSQTSLTTANLASEAATIASAAGFKEAGNAIRLVATAAQLASQSLALIQASSAASTASSSGGGFLGLISGLFGGGGAGAGAGAGIAGNDIALAFAKGGAFDKDGMPGIQGFSVGGVFDAPHLFKFANGGQMSTGVLGEAGPEAILPLKRGPNGALGVSAGGMGGRATQSTVQNYSINVQVQAAQGMSRATATQQGVDIGRGIQRSLARNG